jgi:hypothetical protein
MIDQERFAREMSCLIEKGIHALRERAPEAEIYTVSIWTDAKAQKSAISVDTASNSEAKLAANALRFEKLKAKPRSPRAAAILAKMRPPERNDNPADFRFRNLAMVENDSLRNFDASASDWEKLENLLAGAAGSFRDATAGLKLHSDAQVGVSGRDFWFGRPVPLAERGESE